MPAGTPTVKFPGAYSPGDQIYHQNIYYGYDLALTEFPGGIKTISCGIATGAQNGASGAGDGATSGEVSAPASSLAVSSVAATSAATSASPAAVSTTSTPIQASPATPSPSAGGPVAGGDYGSEGDDEVPAVSGTLPVQGAVATGNPDEPEAVPTGGST